MEAREILAQRAPSLEERINALRDKGVVIGGTTYRYNFAQISAATGVSRSMISMFANGNIRIKPEQQKILEEWVSDIERQAQAEAIETGVVEETPAPAPQNFKRNIELYQTHEFTEALACWNGRGTTGRCASWSDIRASAKRRSSASSPSACRMCMSSSAALRCGCATCWTASRRASA